MNKYLVTGIDTDRKYYRDELYAVSLAFALYDFQNKYKVRSTEVTIKEIKHA